MLLVLASVAGGVAEPDQLCRAFGETKNTSVAGSNAVKGWGWDLRTHLSQAAQKLLSKVESSPWQGCEPFCVLCCCRGNMILDIALYRPCSHCWMKASVTRAQSVSNRSGLSNPGCARFLEAPRAINLASSPNTKVFSRQICHNKSCLYPVGFHLTECTTAGSDCLSSPSPGQSRGDRLSLHKCDRR